MNYGFVKLYGSYLMRSSLWEHDPEVRFVFIGLLMLADKDGFVDCPNPITLKRLLNVPADWTEKALPILEAPDPESRSQEEGGRRIIRKGHGWYVVNHAKYRDMRSERQVKDAERKRAYRSSSSERDMSQDVADMSHVSQDMSAVSAPDHRSQITDTDHREREHNARARVDGIPKTDPMHRATSSWPPGDGREGLTAEAFNWKGAFAASHAAFFGRDTYWHQADHRASLGLAEGLGEMSEAERKTAWENREAAFAAYFAETDRKIASAGHCFAFFVPSIRTYALPKRRSRGTAEAFVPDPRPSKEDLRKMSELKDKALKELRGISGAV